MGDAKQQEDPPPYESPLGVAGLEAETEASIGGRGGSRAHSVRRPRGRQSRPLANQRRSLQVPENQILRFHVPLSLPSSLLPPGNITVKPE